MKAYQLKYNGHFKLKRIRLIHLLKQYGIEHYTDLRLLHQMAEELKANKTVNYIVKDEIAAKLFQKDIQDFPIELEILPDK